MSAEEVAELSETIAEWRTWADGNEDVWLEADQAAARRKPSETAMARFPHGFEDEIWQRDNPDVQDFLYAYAMPRASRVEAMQQRMATILRSKVLKQLMHTGQVLSRSFHRQRREYQDRRADLFQRARDRGSHSTPQYLAVMTLWLTLLRLGSLHDQLHADLQARVIRTEWRLSDFEYIAETSARTTLQIAPSSRVLASYDLEMLDGVLRMIYRVVIEAGIVSVPPFLEFWRALWQCFATLLDTEDTHEGSAGPPQQPPTTTGPRPRPAFLHSLRQDLLGGGGGIISSAASGGGGGGGGGAASTNGIPLVSNSPLNTPDLTEPVATAQRQAEDVRMNRLPEALPFRRGGRQLTLPGMFEYECLYFHMDQLIQLLERYEKAALKSIPSAAARAKFADRVHTLLIGNRQAAAAAAQLLQEEIIMKRDATLNEALYHAFLKRLSDLFLYPGEAELYTLHQLFNKTGGGGGDAGARRDSNSHGDRGSSSKLSSIHDEPYSGHVVSALRATGYAQAARTIENENLLDDIIKKVWETGGQTLADGCMPRLERVANVILLETVDKIMAARECPESMRIKAHCFLDFLSFQEVYPELLKRAPLPTLESLRFSGRCMCRLVHITRRNFIMIPAPDGQDVVVLEVASFPAAIIVWLRFARFDTMENERQRMASLREPLRFIPTQLQALVAEFGPLGDT